MKKNIIISFVVLVLIVLTVSVVQADPPTKLDDKGNEIEWKIDGARCDRIQDGTIDYSLGHYLNGELLDLGFDIFGYNYQAHMFKGSYVNVYLGRDGFPPYEGETDYLEHNPGVLDNLWLISIWPYRDVDLLMKWNDSWLSNTDCDHNGALDRPSDSGSYIGSGAWETNHMVGSYDLDGTTCNWNYFVKIVAVPDGATKSVSIWYSSDGTEIGASPWGGPFAIIQQVENDICAGINGMQYVSPDHPGFGGW